MTAIVFDLDGTLVQSDAAIRDVANSFMRERGLPDLTLAETRAYIGHGSPHFLTEALKKRDAYAVDTFDADFARLQHYYASAPGAANIPFPGVVDALAAFQADGMKLAVCTNKPFAPTQLVLDAHDWTDLFDTVIAGDTLDQRKPDPEPLHEASRRLGTTSLIYVGDSDVDAATAEAGGYPFFLFTEGYRTAAVHDLPHTVAFSDFSQLYGLVTTFLARSS